MQKINAVAPIALAGFVVGLVPWGLQMIGVTVNLWGGAMILAVAFLLGVYAFWRWEEFSRWHKAFRVATVGVAAVIYFTLIGYQINTQYRKDHLAVRANARKTASPALPALQSGPPPQSPKAPPPSPAQQSNAKPSHPSRARQTPPTASPGVIIGGNVTQSSTGNCTANVIGGNANLNCDSTPPARSIPSERYKEIRDYLAAAPATVIVSATGSQESYDFANALFALFKDAGWQMKDGGVRGTTILTGPPWEGITVKFRGSPLLKGQHELITGTTPEDRIGKVLGTLKIRPNADRRPDYPEGTVEVEVGDQARPSPSSAQ